MSVKLATIVIPVYNENDSIVEEMESLFDLGFDEQYEIIIVDDGSTDGTNEKLKEIKNTNKNEFILLRHENNRGYGAALKSGIAEAGTHHIIIKDADSSYPVQMIPELFTEYTDGDYDMVVGARTLKNNAIPLVRRFPKWVLNKLANYLTRTKIPDLNSGLRVFRKNIILDHLNLICDGFSFTTTITLIMLCDFFKVKFTPIEYYKRSGKSKIKPIKDTINFVYLICSTVLYFRPMRVFLPPGILLLFLSFLLGVYQAVFYGNITTITILIFQSGFYLVTIAFLADLISKNRTISHERHIRNNNT